MSEPVWLPHYGDTPSTISYPRQSIVELVQGVASDNRDVTALIYEDEFISYGRLVDEVETLARSLWALGVRPGDRVGLALAAMPHFAISFLAALRVGANAGLIPVSAEPARVRLCVEDFAPEWLVTEDRRVNSLVRLATPVLLRGVVSCSRFDYGSRRALRRLRRRDAVGSVLLRGSGRILGSGYGAAVDDQREPPPVFAWDSLRRVGMLQALPEPGEVKEARTTAAAPVVVFYTSGTSGAVKGVAHGDQQLIAAALQTQVQGPVLTGQTLLSGVSVSTGFGLLVGLVTPLLSGGSTILVPEADDRVRAIRRHRPDYLAGSPLFYLKLVENRSFQRARHRSLMGAFCGSERLSEGVRVAFARIVRKRGGAVTLREGYGLSETVGPCATMPENGLRPGTVGIPYPDMRIGIAEPELHNRASVPVWLPAGAVGEILVHGPTVMEGYWDFDREPKTVSAIDNQGRLWLRTGDLGAMDEEGFLSFIDRCDRAVATERGPIRPGEIEAVIARDEYVAEVYVDVESDGINVHASAVDPDQDSQALERRIEKRLANSLPAEFGLAIWIHRRLPRRPGGRPDAAALAIVAAGHRQ